MLIFATIKPKIAGMISLFLVVALVVINLAPQGVQAQLSTEQIATIQTQCQGNLKDRASDLLAEFYLELDLVAQNTQVVSEQMDGILEQFREFRLEVTEAMENILLLIDFEDTPGAQLRVIESCQQVRDNAINIGKQVMTRFLKQVAANKRDLALTQQYEALLKDSERLYDELSGLKSNFSDFSKRVPCITNRCVQN